MTRPPGGLAKRTHRRAILSFFMRFPHWVAAFKAGPSRGTLVVYATRDIQPRRRRTTGRRRFRRSGFRAWIRYDLRHLLRRNARGQRTFVCPNRRHPASPNSPPSQAHLRRPQLSRPRRRNQPGDPQSPDHLQQIPQRGYRTWRPHRPAESFQPPRLRSRIRLRDRPRRTIHSGRPRHGTRLRLHHCQRCQRPRLSDGHLAMADGQDVSIPSRPWARGS